MEDNWMNNRLFRLSTRWIMVAASLALVWQGVTFLRADPPINHPDHICKTIDCTKVVCRGFDVCLNNNWCDQKVPETTWNKCMPQTASNCNEPTTGPVVRAVCSKGFCPNDNLPCTCVYGSCPNPVVVVDPPVGGEG